MRKGLTSGGVARDGGNEKILKKEAKVRISYYSSVEMHFQQYWQYSYFGASNTNDTINISFSMKYEMSFRSIP